MCRKVKNMKSLKLFILILAFFQTSIIHAEEPLTFDTELLATVKEPYKVTDYFLLLPVFVFEGNLPKADFSTAMRKKILTLETLGDSLDNEAAFYTEIKDEKNGYLSFLSNTDGENEKIEVALFKILNSNIVGITSTYTSKIFLLKFENKTWTDLTSTIWPKLTYTDFLKTPPSPELAKKLEGIFLATTLPKIGRTITVSIPLETWKDLELPARQLTEDETKELFDLMQYKSLDLEFVKDKFVVIKKTPFKK